MRWLKDLPWAVYAASAAILATVGALFYWWSQTEAAGAAARYGRNVDSGVFQLLIAWLYCAPNAVLFAFAALASWRKWRIRLWLQIVALVSLIFPVGLAATFF